MALQFLWTALTAILLSTSVHDFHVSVAELDIDMQEQGITMAVHIFIDDLVRKRNFIAGFQEQMASGYGQSDPQTVNDTSRALTILGRIDAIRERLASG